MAIHSFYVIAWDAGQPIYHRTWVEVSDNPTLLSGLLASVELLALKITQQHVNIVTMRDFRFFFKVDEDNGILLVFITDVSKILHASTSILTCFTKDSLRHLKMYPPISLCINEIPDGQESLTNY
jgi:hypothetical protein